MKIIVFGGSGYIGTEFVNQLKCRGVSVQSYSARQWNTFKQLNNIIKDETPDIVVNCAAYVGETSIVDCERSKHTTMDANVVFPKTLAEACENNKTILGHFSSGCVYDGYGPSDGYREHNFPILSFEKNNCSFYTGTKVMAENYINNITEKRYIWRIRLPFENKFNLRNYLSKLLMYDVLVNAPNSISHKSETVRSCIECIVQGVEYGTYHMTNPGSITAEEIFERFKDNSKFRNSPFFGKKRKFVSVDEFGSMVKDIPRSNTILNTDKLLKANIVMRPVKEAIRETINEWRWE